MQRNSAPVDTTFVTNDFGDRYIKQIISPTISKRNYQEIWQKRYDPLNLTSDHTYIISGSDAGMLIKAFTPRYRSNPLALVFIEDERYISAIADECREELEEMEHVELLTISEFREKVDNYNYDQALLTGRISALKAACAENDQLGSYRPLTDQIHFALDSRRWLVMSTSVRLPYLQQRLVNLPEMAVSASILRDSMPKKTVVVMAAGPSLDQHLEWVKKHREQLIILCVSRISRRLKETGITPDFVVILDPHEISFEVSRESLQFTPSPVLVFSDQGVNKIVGQWPGPKVYMGSRVPWHLEDFELRTGAATVSNLAFDVARLLAPQRIILMGLDFCLDEAGHTHARGNMERETGVSLRTDMEEVTTYDGSIRLSSVDYYNSGKSLEKQIAETDTIEVINPSPGAMKLEGVRFIALDRIRLESDTVSNELNAVQKLITDAQIRSDWLTESGRTLQRFQQQVNEFVKLAGDGLKLVKQAKKNPAGMQKQLHKLNSIDKKIRNRYLPIRRFCVSNCGHLFADILDTGAETGKDNADQSLEKSRKIYRAYKQSVGLIQPMLDDCRDMLSLRQLENNEQWSKELSAHFLSLGLPNRILASDADIPIDTVEAARHLEEEQQSLQTDRLKNVLDSMEISANSLFTTLNGAYTQKSIDKLTHYRNAINEMHDFELRHIYTWLAEAYLAEVTGDDDAALNNYQAIVDQGESPLLEEALNRVAFLCIRTGDSNTAMLALTVLSELNPMYQATLDQFRKVA